MKIRTLTLSLILMAALPVSAQSLLDTGSTNATATISERCTIVSPTGIDFGAYNPVGANLSEDSDAQTTVNVRCTAGTSGAVLRFDKGLATGATCTAGQTARRMRRGTTADYLSYDLYIDAERTQPLGCDQANQHNLADFTSSIEFVSVVVYGRIPAGQNSTAGNYIDTVSASVIF